MIAITASIAQTARTPGSPVKLMLAPALERPLTLAPALGQPLLDAFEKTVDQRRLQVVAELLARLDRRVQLVPDDLAALGGIVPDERANS